MIVVLFKVTCRPERIEDARKAFEQVVAPSRALDGVLAFDIAADLTDANSFVASEVFADRAALDRQESLPEVERVLALFPEILVGEPDATIFDVASSQPYGD